MDIFYGTNEQQIIQKNNQQIIQDFQQHEKQKQELLYNLKKEINFEGACTNSEAQ